MSENRSVKTGVTRSLQAERLAELVKMDRTHRRMFEVFVITMLMWVAAVVLYAAVHHYKLFPWVHTATNILTWMSVFFVVSGILSLYYGRVLYDALVPTVVRLELLLKEEGPLAKPAVDDCLDCKKSKTIAK